MWLYLLLIPILIIAVKDGPGLGSHFKIAGIMLPVVALYCMAEGIPRIDIIQLLYPGVKYLSDTPINFWRYLLAITAPSWSLPQDPNKASACVQPD